MHTVAINVLKGEQGGVYARVFEVGKGGEKFCNFISLRKKRDDVNRVLMRANSPIL